MRGHEVAGGLPSVGIGALGAPEEQDVGFGLMDFIVVPAAGLLDAEGAPLAFGENFALVGDLAGDFLGQDDVAVLVVVVVVLVGIFDFSRVMRHLNNYGIEYHCGRKPNCHCCERKLNWYCPSGFHFTSLFMNAARLSLSRGWISSSFPPHFRSYRQLSIFLLVPALTPHISNRCDLSLLSYS